MGVMMNYWTTIKAFSEKPYKIPNVFFEFFPIRYCNFAAP